MLKYTQHFVRLVLVVFAFSGTTSLLNANDDLTFFAGTLAAGIVVAFAMFALHHLGRDIKRDFERYHDDW